MSIVAMRHVKFIIWLVTLLLIVACDTLIVEADDADLVRKLEADQPTNRLETIESIRKLEPKAAIAFIPDLTRCINDKDHDVRIAAINAVVEIAIEAKLACPETFVEALFHEDAGIRHLAVLYVDAFDKVPKEFTPQLLKAMNHHDPYVRAHVASPLQRAGGKDGRTVRALRTAMRDNDLQVAYNASIAYFHATEDVSTVLPFWLKLADSDWEPLPPDGAAPRWRLQEEFKIERFIGSAASIAVQSAGRRAPERIGKALIGLLSDITPRLRRSAAHAIGLIAGGNLKSRESLEELDAREALRKLEADGVKSVRTAAEGALKRFTVEIVPLPPQSKSDSKDLPPNFKKSLP